ncbi:MAG: spondin domain-containing protein [Acidobacteriota bacterium]|nr:MAG: spondin domain-containing protein [Acidobacteriota bacterium]
MRIMQSCFIGAIVAVLVGIFAAPGVFAQAKDQQEVRFTVRIENVSSPDGQIASNNNNWPFALSPGLWVIHNREVRLFRTGNPAINGLEALAEDGNPGELIKALDSYHGMMLHGIFNTPVGAMSPGPIGPGNAYEFSFTAKPGMKLSLLTMFGQSNDWFYAPAANGIDLFRNGRAVSGDMTREFMLYDAGTEMNEEPGIGPNQAPRQKMPNTGAAENGRVMKAKSSPFFNRTSELFRVIIRPEGDMAATR